jgi:uncharacterized RDD family membrane protein YckC
VHQAGPDRRDPREERARDPAGELRGQPIGPGWAFLRYLLHTLDGFCYLGYLWPIWDSRKQTFADKIMNTFVIQATTPQERPFR